MEPKDMTNTYLLELIRDRRFYLSDEVDELLRRLNEADALRKENEELAYLLENLDGKTCPTCEGNGQIWADGKCHYQSYNGDVVFCPTCGGGKEIKTTSFEINEALKRRSARLAKESEVSK